MKAILTYHSLDDSGSAISVAPDVFRQHAAWLASGPVRVLSLEDLLSADSGVQAVALTFDDAFQNFASVAAPVLRQFDLPATLYVVTEHAGADNDWGGRGHPGIPRLPLLDWDTLGQLSEQGVALGNHTRTHPDLTRLSAAAMKDELHSAHEAIMARTGACPGSVAYPFGRENETVSTAASELYSVGVTTELRPLGSVEAFLRLPRLDMYYLRTAGQLETWGTRRFDQRLWLRRQARRLRRTFATVGGGAGAGAASR
jgi:peptidoglycan/xylan/chitin deacetylase (PgdA/CDA1 family)